MDDEIIPADRKLRGRVLWWGGVATLGGLIVLAAVSRLLDVPEDATDAVLRLAVDRAIRLARVSAWVMGLSFVVMGLWFLRLGRLVRRSGRFPPPGMRVIKDTSVRTGIRARCIANLATVTGLASALFGSVAVWFVYRMVAVFLGP